MNNRGIAVKALLAAAMVVAVISAHAEEWRGREWHGPRGPWHADLRHFDRHDHALWRRGLWRHEWHGGRLGWWWVAGGDWFFYPQPIYPYPDPYAYIEPAPVVVQPAPPQISAPPQQLWYFCAAANAYYPYVSSCPGGWQTVPVPASPPVPPAATVVPSPPGSSGTYPDAPPGLPPGPPGR
ncbi:MAG: hypothetical protein V4443_04415 [Pseudomonadota bacterium]